MILLLSIEENGSYISDQDFRNEAMVTEFGKLVYLELWKQLLIYGWSKNVYRGGNGITMGVRRRE